MESAVNDFRDALVWDRLIYALLIILIPALCTVVLQNLKHIRMHHLFGRGVTRRARRLAAIVDPYLSVRIDENEGTGRMMRRSGAYYEEVKAYLSESCSCTARNLRAEGARDGDAAADRLVLSMQDGEEVADQFQGATVWWSAHTSIRTSSDSGGEGQEERCFMLHYHKRHRDLVLRDYLHQVQQGGRGIMVTNRQRKIFTNVFDNRARWSHVPFKHPMKFDKLAMDPVKRKEIIDDLDEFKNGKEHYASVGKAWKRGYLLYGPPGTGKSTMIAAMANHLDYDVYIIELTSVKSNSDLQMLMMEIKNKAIIVIEDIGCSLEPVGAREKKKLAFSSNKAAESDHSVNLTLSGLLNVVDGLLSACGEERIIVFTTYHVDRLDPALIRRGRMDRHIEMSYCGFEAFKSLAKTHLGVESHRLFGKVRELLEEVDMTPAEAIEILTPKRRDDNPADSCLANLVNELERYKKRR